MPIQLFGRDQIVIDYESNHNYTTNHWYTFAFQNFNEYFIQNIKKYIKGIQHFQLFRITIIHWIVLVGSTILLLNLINIYQNLYEKSPLFATMCTNILLFSVSDTFAQCIFCYLSYRIDPIPKLIANTTRNIASQLDMIYFVDSDEEVSIYSRDSISSDPNMEENETSINDCRNENNIFDFHRWLYFMFWGWFVSFFRVPWYKFLNYLYSDGPELVQVLERVLSDQLIYSPISLYCFFMYSNYIMEGGDKESFQRKIRKVYLSTLGCNYLIWPIVQFVNFLFLPKQLQVPFGSSIGVFWNCFLSMRNASSMVSNS